MKNIDHNLIKRLPEHILRLIIGYTLEPQPAQLLLDIRSFVMDISLLDNLYNFNYNESILLNDILMFYSMDHIDSDFYNKMRRFRNLRSKPDTYIIEFYSYYCYNSVTLGTIRNRIRVMWGMLTPTERTCMINVYWFNDEFISNELQVELSNNISQILMLLDDE